MKRLYKNTCIGLAVALMPLAISLTFTSCSDETDVVKAVESGETVSVGIGVRASGMSDLSTTRSYNGDYNAEEGEFIHSLCILVVNVDYDEYWWNGNVTGFTLEKKLEPDLSDDPDAQKGNLSTWYSFYDITAGDKILLAFANWENVVDFENDDDGWAKLLSMKEGDTFTATSYEELTAELSILVDDPASKVDIANGQYIPMSGFEEVYFYHYGVDVAYIPLERLVAKVTLAGQVVDYTEEADYTGENAVTFSCTGGTLSGTNDKVWLFHYYYDDFYFADESYPTEATDYDGTAQLSLATNPTINMNGGIVNLGTFYVNETVLTQYASHFSLQWGLNSTKLGRNLTFGATTNAGVLQRNSVMPLVFSWDYDSTGVVVNAWIELTEEEIIYDPNSSSVGDIT